MKQSHALISLSLVSLLSFSSLALAQTDDVWHPRAKDTPKEKFVEKRVFVSKALSFSRPEVSFTSKMNWAPRTIRLLEVYSTLTEDGQMRITAVVEFDGIKKLYSQTDRFTKTWSTLKQAPVLVSSFTLTDHSKQDASCGHSETRTIRMSVETNLKGENAEFKIDASYLTYEDTCHHMGAAHEDLSYAAQK